MEPKPKRTKLENCSPLANVKDKCFVDLTGSPELASCSKGCVPPNTQANTQWSVKTFNSWMDWRVKGKPVDPVQESQHPSQRAQECFQQQQALLP